MPSESKAQQRLMGMALAYKRGKMPHASAKIKEVSKGMNEKQLRDFAKTETSELPEKKAFIKGFFERAAEYGIAKEAAEELHKQSFLAPMAVPMNRKPVIKKPAVGAGDLNDRIKQPGAKGPGPIPAPGTPGYE